MKGVLLPAFLLWAGCSSRAVDLEPIDLAVMEVDQASAAPDLGSRPCRAAEDCETFVCLDGHCVPPQHFTLDFLPPTVLAVPGKAGSLVPGDFDEDGQVDLAVGFWSPSGVYLFRNLGQGRFAAPIPFDLAVNLVATTAQDFNNDGHLDLVGAGYPELVVLLGRGDGSFRSVSTPIPFNPTVAVADLDRDGAADVVLGYYDNAIRVFAGRGDGTFAPPVATSIGFQPFSLAIADWDGDQWPDLLAQDVDEAKMVVERGNGRGGFAQAIVYNGLAGGGFLLTDLDRDGDLDLVRDAERWNGVQVFLHHAGGGLGTLVPCLGGSPRVAADFDLDANLDIGGTSDSPGRIAVFRGDGAGGLASPVKWPVAVDYPGHMVAPDFNGDGRPDIAVTQPESRAVSVYLNDSK